MRSRHALGTLSLSLIIVGLIGTVVAGTISFDKYKSSFDEYKSGVVWPKPPIVTSGSATTAPSDAIVLFDGSNMDAFVGGQAWKVEEGEVTVQGRTIHTKQSFGDCQLHVEFASPSIVKGKGQGRGNSGIYLMQKYEVQILDSFENETYFDGQCGAIYKQQPPTVNACRAPGKWQSYDILFTAPRFKKDGSLDSPAFLTVLHNGVMIHNHVKLTGDTAWNRPPRYARHAAKLPLTIQNHGNPVKFRNIWVRENVTPLIGKPPVAKKSQIGSEKK